jgi:DNA-binding MarR family transcriptional regulator
MPNLCIIPARALTLLADGDLTPTDIVILCSIGEHTDKNGEGCWASSRTLSDKAGVHRSTFFASTTRLVRAGLIERESGQTDGKTSTYRVLLDRQGVSRQQDTPRPATKTPVSAATDTPTINDPLNDPLNESPSATVTTSEYLADAEELFSRIIRAQGSPGAWIAEMVAARDGMHGPIVTKEQVGQAIRDFNAAGGDISLRLFRGYLRDAAKPPKPTREAFSDSSSLGVQTSPQMRKAVATGWATDLIEKLKAIRVQATEGVRVGHLYVPQNWKESFQPEEAKAIASVGHNRLLSHDDITASVARSELVNILSGYARAVK